MSVTSAGRRRHFVQLENPVGEAVADGDGLYTQSYGVFAEDFASIDPASQQKLERFFSDAQLASASSVVVIPFRSGVSLQTRVRFSGRQLNVIGYADPEERHIELVLLCQELKR